MTAATLADALHAVRSGATSKTMTRCPAHDDGTASLSVSLGAEGRVLLHCHAGCDFHSILEAAGVDRGALTPGTVATMGDWQRDQGEGATLEGVIDFWRKKGLTLKDDSHVYRYHDANDRLAFLVLRLYDSRGDKTFRQHAHLGGDRFAFNAKGVRLVPYRLPELLKAPADATVYIVEGEKDADRLRALGLVATTSPAGAGKWRDEYVGHLRGRRVVILPDADEPGRRHGQDVERSLRGVAADVRTVELPGLAHHGDVSDWLDAGGTRDDLERVTAVTEEPASEARSEAERERRPSAAEVMIGIGATNRMIVDERGDGYALVQNPRGFQTWRLRSRSYRQALQSAHYRQTGRAAAGEAVATAVATLEAMARDNGERVRMHTRIAHVDGAAWLDLCDGTGRAIRVTTKGWTVENAPAVYFRRHAHQEALPEPERGGDLRELLQHVRARAEDRVLALVWPVVALLPDVDRAMPILHGPPGAGKTTAARMLRRLVDPSATDVLRLPRSEHELAIILDHHAVPAVDNLSGLPAWASDMLCTAVTGGAYIARELYTDGDEVLLTYRVAPILTGITIPATAPDLLDRALLLELAPIPPTGRREARDLWAAFEAARPRLLGAMLDTLSAAMRIYPTLHLPRLERLADWTRWGAAVAEALGYGTEALGYGAEALLKALGRQREERTAEVLQSHPVAEEILTLMRDRMEWTGTASDIHKRREPGRGGAGEWPRTAQGIRSQVPRLIPVLAAAGIQVDRGRTGHGGRRLWRITRSAESGISSSPSSPSSPDTPGPAPSCDPATVTMVVTIPEHSPASSPHRHPHPHHTEPHTDAIPAACGEDSDDGDDAVHTSTGHDMPDWLEV